MRNTTLLATVLLLSWTASAYADKPCRVSVFKNSRNPKIEEYFEKKLSPRSFMACREAALGMLNDKCKSGSALGNGLGFANGTLIKQTEKCRYDPPPESDLIKARWYFDNSRSDGEHAYGISIEIWEYRGKLIGILTHQAGLIGNPKRALLHKVKYNKSTGRLSFEADLYVEQINFSGTVEKEYLVPDEGSAFGNLKREKWDHKRYPLVQRYSEWEKDAKRMISFSRAEWTY